MTINNISDLAGGRSTRATIRRPCHRAVSGQFRVRCDLRLLTGKNLATALEYGAAHGALAMTTPGDTSMASLREVENPMKGARARV
jgi:hypothetical protein